jgi:hypothetical protein
MSEGHGHESAGHEHPTPSAGIAPVMWLFIALSLVVICMQAAFVIGSSGMGHTWPAGDSTKIQLPEPAR